MFILMARVSVALMAIVLLATPVSAVLSDADRDALTLHLDALRNGWDQPAVDGANAIFNKNIYGTPDWITFFGGYFSTRAMTEALRNYIVYPTFWWFDDVVHEKLQSGLASVAMPHVRSVVISHPTDLGPWLASSPLDREALVSWLRIIAELGLHSAPGFDRRTVYTWTRDLILDDRRFVATAVISPTEQPYVNYVRMQLQMTLADSQPRTVEVVAEIADVLDLSGDRLEMWQRHSLLVHDNQFLNSADWAFLRTLWDSIPAGLPKPHNVSVNDAIGNSGSQNHWTVSYSGVNIFAIHVPSFLENGFPEEVSPIYASGFGLVAVHELNHVVDYDLVGLGRPLFDPVLEARRRALVADAGRDRYNYLRSMFEDGLFSDAPQEFFASISNMYFANTAATFRVGERRLQAGRHQPIEQFLFFLDVYSQGSNRSRGYTLDVSANLSWYDIPLSRDAQGRIIRFTLPDRAYGVTYNASGHVASTSTAVPCGNDAGELCLSGGRFAVAARWTAGEQSGDGIPIPLTSDTGYFWFFSSSNVELVVKVVDGAAFNSRFWVFAGGLTDVSVALTVTDTETGAVRTYTNPQGVAFQPIQDTNAFTSTGAVSPSDKAPADVSGGQAAAEHMGQVASWSQRRASEPLSPRSVWAQSSCVGDAGTLCLNGGRFSVQTRWTTPQGQSGEGQAVILTSDTGYFWFFSSNNVEVVVKAVTGCTLNSRYWVFAGGLTNVSVEMTVTDTQTGAVEVYTNPQNTAFQPIQDTSAFVCP